MDSMFFQASAFNQALDSWDVSRSNNMYKMFYNAAMFNQNLDSWDVSSVTTMDDMFTSAPARYNVALCGYHWHQNDEATVADRMTFSNDLCMCPPGTYCAEGSPTDFDPLLCDTLGHYCPKGSTSSEPCPGGGHCPDTSTFVPCEVGTFSANTWQVAASACTGCPEIIGTYCPPGSLSPTSCPAGFFCPDTTTITPCPAGTFCNATGKSSNEACSPCEAGGYCLVGSSSPTLCKATTFSSDTAQVSDEACSLCTNLGTYCPAGSVAPVNCPEGSYCPHTGMRVQCPSGTFSSATGQAANSDCSACEMGDYCPQGSTSARLCPPGFYCPDFASLIQCEAGKFQTEFGKTDPESCSGCGLGFYAVNATACRTCPSGTYSDVSGAEECQSCPVGTYGNRTSQINVESCLPCNDGWYQSDPGSLACIICPVGHKCDNTAEAVACGVGTEQAREGRSSCDPCDDGWYQLREGQPCIICPVGYRCPTAIFEPINCTAGKYQPGEGSTDCMLCSQGTYQSQEGSSACEQCQLGSFQSKEGQVSPEACVRCPPGKHGESKGASECLACGEGTFQSGFGSHDCSSCESGSFNSAIAQHTCQEAFPGTFTANPDGGYTKIAATRQLPCLAGHFCENGTLRECQNGQYCPQGTAEPAGCAPGIPPIHPSILPPNWKLNRQDWPSSSGCAFKSHLFAFDCLVTLLGQYICHSATRLQTWLPSTSTLCSACLSVCHMLVNVAALDFDTILLITCPNLSRVALSHHVRAAPLRHRYLLPSFHRFSGVVPTQPLLRVTSEPTALRYVLLLLTCYRLFM
jgi:hypothetical protein